MTLNKPLGTIAVIDIETEPDPFAVALAPRGGPANRTALHRITAFSVLSAIEGDDSEWRALDLQTRSGSQEYEMLFDLDAILTPLQEARASVVTYNGVAHDLPALRRRTIANWLFALPGLRGLANMPHLDLMREATRGGRGSWPSLKDLCASCGIPTDHQLVRAIDEEASVAHRKCQVDVAATFLLMAHELSAVRGDSKTVSRAWLALADLLQRRTFRKPHLAQFVHHPAIERARAERG
ncbi:hypothetical protein GCM10011380_31430 [Sphingomonas metalli]|uniref:Uncharacterized protein n=2 Tax=Sphingomonas metalli TaxID=1779358 RepID=A0A916TDS2_9SPHN|nr:hypothetical protein GCM10011380_31430 [Sphingomonas metalli]